MPKQRVLIAIAMGVLLAGELAFSGERFYKSKTGAEVWIQHRSE